MVIVPSPVEKVFTMLAFFIPRLVANVKMGGQDGYIVEDWKLMWL